MLRLSDEYRCLLHLSSDVRHRLIGHSVPELPIAPFAYVVLGRLSSLQRIDTWPQLHTSMQAVSVKTAMKKISNQPRPQLVDVDRAAVEAENPPYLLEMAQYMKDHPSERCRYLIIEDALHANSISRFHFVFKREVVQASDGLPVSDVSHTSTTNQVAAAAADSNVTANVESTAAAASASSLAAAADSNSANATSSSSSPAAPSLPLAFSSASPLATPLKDATTTTYKYYVMDLGSLNGMYINGDKTRSQVWLPLSEGDKLRFAPLTRASRMYSSKLAEAKAEERNQPPSDNPFSNITPSTPQPVIIPNDVSALSNDSRMYSIFEQVRQSAARSNLPAVNSKDIHIEFVFSHRVTQKCIERDLTLARAIDNNNILRTVPPPARPQPAVANMQRTIPINPSPPNHQLPLVVQPIPPGIAALQSPQPQPVLQVKREPISNADLNAAAAAFTARSAALQAVSTPVPVIDDEDEVLEVPPFPTSAAARQRKRKADEANFSQSSQSQSHSQPQQQQRSSQPTNESQQDSKRMRTSGDAVRTSTPREVVEIDDDENVPLTMLKRKSSSNPASSAAAAVPSSAAASSSSAMDISISNTVAATSAAASSSAAAASSSSSSSAAAAAAAPVNARMTSLLDEFNCGICSDVIYKNVVLDCSHSFCRGCIEQWFKKKKICPICREKHKGAPRAVRSADNVIAQLVEFALTDEEKKERNERIRLSDLEWKEREDKKEERAKLRALRKAGAAAPASSSSAESRLESMLQQMLAHHQAAHDRMGGRSGPMVLDDDDLDYDDDDLDDDDEEEFNQVVILPPPRMTAPRRNAAPPAPAPAPVSNYTVDVTTDRTTACRICCSLIEPNLLRLKRMQLNAAAPQHFHLSCYRNDRTGNYPAFGLHQLRGYDSLPAEHVARFNELMGRRP